VAISRSHGRRDDNMDDMNSSSVSRHRHSPGKSTRRAHAYSGPERSPSVSPIRRLRIRPESYIFQGKLRKLKPLNFDGEHRKGGEVET
jgi:hypothetical protein